MLKSYIISSHAMSSLTYIYCPCNLSYGLHRILNWCKFLICTFMGGLGFKLAWIQRISKTNKSKMPSDSCQIQEITGGIKCAALCPVILKISRRFSCSNYECSIPSQRLSEAVLTIIACQARNYMLQIPAGLNLARHILFRVCALAATVGRLCCLQILH